MKQSGLLYIILTSTARNRAGQLDYHNRLDHQGLDLNRKMEKHKINSMSAGTPHRLIFSI